MTNDLRNWFSFAFGLISLLLTLTQMLSRKPQTIRRRRERVRMLRWGSFEWMSHERDDERQS